MSHSSPTLYSVISEFFYALGQLNFEFVQLSCPQLIELANPATDQDHSKFLSTLSAFSNCERSFYFLEDYEFITNALSSCGQELESLSVPLDQPPPLVPLPSNASDDVHHIVAHMIEIQNARILLSSIFNILSQSQPPNLNDAGFYIDQLNSLLLLASEWRPPEFMQLIQKNVILETSVFKGLLLVIESLRTFQMKESCMVLFRLRSLLQITWPESHVQKIRETDPSILPDVTTISLKSTPLYIWLCRFAANLSSKQMLYFDSSLSKYLTLVSELYQSKPPSPTSAPPPSSSIKQLPFSGPPSSNQLNSSASSISVSQPLSAAARQKGNSLASLSRIGDHSKTPQGSNPTPSSLTQTSPSSSFIKPAELSSGRTLVFRISDLIAPLVPAIEKRPVKLQPSPSKTVRFFQTLFGSSSPSPSNIPKPKDIVSPLDRTASVPITPSFIRSFQHFAHRQPGVICLAIVLEISAGSLRSSAPFPSPEDKGDKGDSPLDSNLSLEKFQHRTQSKPVSSRENLEQRLESCMSTDPDCLQANLYFSTVSRVLDHNPHSTGKHGEYRVPLIDREVATGIRSWPIIFAVPSLREVQPHAFNIVSLIQNHQPLLSDPLISRAIDIDWKLNCVYFFARLEEPSVTMVAICRPQSSLPKNVDYQLSEKERRFFKKFCSLASQLRSPVPKPFFTAHPTLAPVSTPSSISSSSSSPHLSLHLNSKAL